MKILSSLKTGITRAIKTWKGVVIIWVVSLILVSLVAIPMKATLVSGLGNSMITEKLKDGFNLEAFSDMGSTFKSLTAFFSKGLVMLFLSCILINSFLSAGLFNMIKKNAGIFSSGEFFRNAADYFYSFLIISLIITIIFIILAILLVVIPIALVIQSHNSTEIAVFKVAVISISIYLFLALILILVADYARAWQAVNERNDYFRALRFGIRSTFRTFYSSYPLMLILSGIQVLFGLAALRLISWIMPESETGIIALFVISQLLFFVRLMLKTMRSGSVTGLMEINDLNHESAGSAD